MTVQRKRKRIPINVKRSEFYEGAIRVLETSLQKPDLDEDERQKIKGLLKYFQDPANQVPGPSRFKRCA